MQEFVAIFNLISITLSWHDADQAWSFFGFFVWSGLTTRVSQLARTLRESYDTVMVKGINPHKSNDLYRLFARAFAYKFVCRQ